MKDILVLAAVALCAPTIACAKDVSGAWKFEATGNTFECFIVVSRVGPGLEGVTTAGAGVKLDDFFNRPAVEWFK